MGGAELRRFREYWAKQGEWWLSRSMEWWAAYLTAIYVGGAILVMAARFGELLALRLNEVGDLLAGVFGPIAFLWFVLGYRQQGRELAISSASIILQTKELAASVEQQAELVQVQKEQLNNYNRSIEPLLTLEYEKTSSGARGEWGDHFWLKNTGHYCQQIVAGMCSFSNSVSFDYLGSGDTRRLILDGISQQGPFYYLSITYVKINGVPGCQRFQIRKPESGEYEDESIFIEIVKLPLQ